MKKKRRSNRKNVKDLAARPDQVPYVVRSHVIAIDLFLDELAKHRQLFADLGTFASVREYLSDIEGSLDEGIGWLFDYLDGNIDYDTLQCDLRLYTANGLEATLDATPTLFNEVPPRTPKRVESLMDDMEGLVEQLSQDIQRKGYALHGVLIGADFCYETYDLIQYLRKQ